jgi:hypothetical protein
MPICLHLGHPSSPLVLTKRWFFTLSTAKQKLVEGVGFAHHEAPERAQHLPCCPFVYITIAGVLLWYPSKELVEVDLRHRSLLRGTSSTNLMPICLHLDYSSSPLVSTKELREVDLRHRSHLSDTTFTMLPICLHQPYDCSPLVSLKE